MMWQRVLPWLDRPIPCILHLHDWSYVSYGGCLPCEFRFCPACITQQTFKYSIWGTHYGKPTVQESIKWASMRTHIMRQYLIKQEEVST